VGERGANIMASIFCSAFCFCFLFLLQRGWILKEDKYYYFELESEKETKQEIPSYKMIQYMLEYAKELERIV